MSQISIVRCRGCNVQDCEAIGELPDCPEFARLALPNPLPGGILYRCRNCALVFRSPICTSEEYGRLYARLSAKTWSHRPWILRNDQELARNYIESYVCAGARILDIGCFT